MLHHNTDRRVLATIVAPDELDRLVGEHLRELPGAGCSDLVALDRKTVRGTIGAAHPRGTHLLGASRAGTGRAGGASCHPWQGQRDPGAPGSLAGRDLRGTDVATDALHTQRGLSRQIPDAGRDDLWLVKDNQSALRGDIELLSTADDRSVAGGRSPHDFQTARQADKGQGRREPRALTASAELAGSSDWPGLRQVFRLERSHLHRRSGKQTHEVVDGLTSLPHLAAGLVVPVPA